MRRELVLVVLALGFLMVINGCCRCKKDIMTTSTIPAASAQISPAQDSATTSSSGSYRNTIK